MISCHVTPLNILCYIFVFTFSPSFLPPPCPPSPSLRSTFSHFSLPLPLSSFQFYLLFTHTHTHTHMHTHTHSHTHTHTHTGPPLKDEVSCSAFSTWTRQQALFVRTAIVENERMRYVHTYVQRKTFCFFYHLILFYLPPLQQFLKLFYFTSFFSILGCT